MSNFYNKNLYKMLGVTSDATPTEIKVAYRTLVRKLHPDVSSNPQDTERFKELKDVYEILIDPEKRKKYDILYNYYISKNYHTKPENEEPKPDIKPDIKSDISEEQPVQHTEDIKNDDDNEVPQPKKKKTKKKEDDFTSKLNNVMNTLFSSEDKNDENSSQSEESLDIFMDISVTVNEAIEGTSRIVNILHSAPCPNCGGKKFVNGASCIMCQGTGEISIYKKLNVKIPPGIMNGSKIRVKGEGNSSPDGSEDGDLYLNVVVQHSDMFKYDNLNILCDVPITPYEAVLGATVEIPTPQGIFKMKVPPMTNSGQKFRISGEGLLDKETNNKGDVIATVTIKIPPSYTNDEIKHYKQLKKLSAYNVREVTDNE